MGDNIVDKVVDEDSKLVISNKAVKWVIGILLTGVTGILGFAWGLYITLDAKVDVQYEGLKGDIEKSETAIIDKMEELDKEKVKPNSDKNYKQDLDIVRLYERTNSRGISINHNTERPAAIITPDTTRSSALPSIN